MTHPYLNNCFYFISISYEILIFFLEKRINILNICYKIYIKTLNEKLKSYQKIFLHEKQCGFRKGRSCIDAAFTLKLLLEKSREFNLETHIRFLDHENTFDEVRRPVLFNVLQNKNIPNPLFVAIKKYMKTTN